MNFTNSGDLVAAARCSVRCGLAEVFQISGCSGLTCAGSFVRALRVAAVAIGAAELHRGRGVHRLDALVTGQAAHALRIGLGLRLAMQRRKFAATTARGCGSAASAMARGLRRTCDRYPFHQKVRITFVKTWYERAVFFVDVLEAAAGEERRGAADDDDVVGSAAGGSGGRG